MDGYQEQYAAFKMSLFLSIRMMAGMGWITLQERCATLRKADWRAMYSTPASMGTRCHQLAAYIVHDSPFTMFVMRLPIT